MTTLKQNILNKFSDKLTDDKQRQLFCDCLDKLQQFFDYSVQRKYRKKDAFFIEHNEIDTEQFKNTYNYWLYDRFTGLFFNNIQGKHQEFRCCLAVLKFILDGWKGDLAIIDKPNSQIEELYIALNFGFYESGAFNFGGSGTQVICSDDFNDYPFPFLRFYDLQPINDFYKQVAHKTLQNEFGF